MISCYKINCCCRKSKDLDLIYIEFIYLHFTIPKYLQTLMWQLT